VVCDTDLAVVQSRIGRTFGLQIGRWDHSCCVRSEASSQKLFGWHADEAKQTHSFGCGVELGLPASSVARRKKAKQRQRGEWLRWKLPGSDNVNSVDSVQSGEGQFSVRRTESQLCRPLSASRSRSHARTRHVKIYNAHSGLSSRSPTPTHSSVLKETTAWGGDLGSGGRGASALAVCVGREKKGRDRGVFSAQRYDGSKTGNGAVGGSSDMCDATLLEVGYTVGKRARGWRKVAGRKMAWSWAR
jgi:hypothetical protein